MLQFLLLDYKGIFEIGLTNQKYKVTELAGKINVARHFAAHLDDIQECISETTFQCPSKLYWEGTVSTRFTKMKANIANKKMPSAYTLTIHSPGSVSCTKVAYTNN